MTGATLESLDERDVAVAGLGVHLAQRGSGPMLVVLHHSTGPLWSPFYDALAADFTVIAPDMPGYGKSDRPDTARHPSHLAVLLLQALRTLGTDRVHLVGLGIGGWVAAEMAAMNQDRLASLTLVGAAGIKPREGKGEIHDPMMESWTEYSRQSFRDDDAFAAVFGAAPDTEVLEVWDFSREMTARITWKPWMWSLPLPMLLAGVATPTLVVWGSEDRIVPIDCGEQYAAALSNARLEVVQGAGHVVDLEQPERLAELIVKFSAPA